MNKLVRAIEWREAIQSEEMIEAPNYRKDYLGYSSISQKELNIICEIANDYWKKMDSPLRIGNSMGEIIPGFNFQRSLELEKQPGKP